MTMQPKGYPIEQITPEASDADKQAAVKATVEQMVSEGMTPEQAQTQVMQLLQSIMESPSWPQSGTTNYGETMKPPPNNLMRERGSSNPKSIPYFRNIPNDTPLSNFVHGFNSDGRVSNK